MDSEVAPSPAKKHPMLKSVRLLFSIVLGFCYLVNYMQRTNMSIAIVCMVNSTAVYELETGKFIWSKTDQGLILSAYFYGYILTQVVGGLLALKFGGLKVIVSSMLLSSIVTMLIAPVANLNSIIALFSLRFLTGFFHGFTLPALSFMFAKWAPPDEKTTLFGLAGAGRDVGSEVSLLAGSYLCEYGFYEGWGSIFILFGGVGLFLVLSLIVLVSETPANHRFMSETEKNYLFDQIPASKGKKLKLKTPWKAIFTSRACYAIIISHFCLNWGSYLFLTQAPTYMKEVLKFDIKSNGLYSSIPYLVSLILTVLGAIVSDKLIKNNILSTLNTRKLFNSLAMFVPMVCTILLGLIVDCSSPFIGVFLLTIGQGFMGMTNSAGYAVNVIDVSGHYSGVLYGISNSFATIPGILAPFTVGLITPKGTDQEWNVVFRITAVVFLIGGLVFLLLARAKPEEWAHVDHGDEQTPEQVQLNSKEIK